MAQSLANILVHVIFGTKNREPLILESLAKEMSSYLAGALRELDSPPLTVNAVSDHVHFLCSLSRTSSISELIENVKTSSSKWFKTKDPSLRDFRWQNGYGAFSVSPSNAEAVREYIARQQAHHRTVTFQEEFRAFLDRHGVEYGERYVWG